MLTLRFPGLLLCIALSSFAQIGVPPNRTVSTGAINKTVLEAKRVLVTTMLGPRADPTSVRGADHEAVGAVETTLKRWKKYQLTRTEEDADLILAVRKAPGRGVTFGNPRVATPIPPTVNNPLPDTADCLALFDAKGVGMQRAMESAPLWTACSAGGLTEPEVRLVKEFRAAVERAEK
jgi:hypothetical protein